MPFANRIRLPLKVTRPQFPQERNAFRKADGSIKTLSVVIRKILEGETDYLPEKWHERLVIALGHDIVNIEGDNYLTGISQEGDYDIAWIEFLNFNTAKGKFKVQVTPFNATNANCQTCEEATQVDLVDDTVTGIYGGLQEGTLYTWDVKDNDSICCYPAVFSISWFDPDYLSACTISQLGIISITTKTGLVAVNNMLLAIYRVMCPNGGYDEANVYASINGTIAGCLSPLNLSVTGVTSQSATFVWDDPDPAPVNDYIYEVFRVDSPGSPVQTGTSPGPSITLSGFAAGVDYIFYLKSDCGASLSNNVSIDFTTEPENEVCGQYQITYQIQPSNNPPYVTISYTDCSGDPATAYIILPNVTTLICALQSSAGNPVHIVTDYPTRTDIEYLGLC